MVKFIKLVGLLVPLLIGDIAYAARIENQIAVFNALEKITATTEIIEININETKKFGVFEITPRICYTRSKTERPKTTSFIEIDEVSTDGNDIKRVFTGWMFASNHGLHGVEHPVYDIWLVDCKNPVTK